MANLTGNYHDYQTLDASFSKLLPGVLSIATESQQANPKEQWKQLVNNTLLLLISYKPTNYRAYQYKLYLYLFGNHYQQEFTSIEDCQIYFDLLLRVSFCIKC